MKKEKTSKHEKMLKVEFKLPESEYAELAGMAAQSGGNAHQCARSIVKKKIKENIEGVKNGY
jgi:hypothetical protein